MPKRSGSSGGGARNVRGVGRRVAVVAGVLGLIWFAVQGGEYGTFDLFSQKARRARMESEVADLRRVVDSLTKWKRAILTDPVVQERIVREEFGMVRGDHELLYRFVDRAEAGR